MKNEILVIYVGVQGIRGEDIEEFVQKVTKKIIPVTFKGEIIVIPTQSPDTKIECINPKYITYDLLIKEHTEMIKKLQEKLQHQLKEYKKEKK